ncbi:MAG: glyoxalase family protein [Solirubrobacteraceae bacterium]|nr:glyoxalase family protein [Solirubrobacteraceae bacterium]
MALEGLHHITAITGDAPTNVDFYVRVLGLRMVKRTVNQDDPTVYHLFYADERGSAGADITFFEYPGAVRGTAGAGMVHRIVHRVATHDALDFWEARLTGEDAGVERLEGGLRFHDPEGLEHELAVADVPDTPLTARSKEVPEESALQGFHAVHALTADPEGSAGLLEGVLGFTETAAQVWECRGVARGGSIHYDRSGAAGRSGAGTVHHVAWGSPPDELEEWQQTVARAGARPTPIIDRFYFRSVYFREPSGVLFELASIGPGFSVDEAADALGEGLSLPPDFERLRERLGDVLTPLPDVTTWRP